MAISMRSEEVRRDSNASSALNQSSLGTEAHIQGDPLTDSHVGERQAALKIEMFDGRSNERNGGSDWPSDAIHKSSRPTKGPGALDIEHALGLTAVQGKRFRDVVKSELEKAGLLGKMESSCTKPGHQEGLHQVVTATKDQLQFLRAPGIPAVRLDELILARARINNANELHNERLIKTGRVRVRSGTPRPCEKTATAISEDHHFAQQPANVGNLAAVKIRGDLHSRRAMATLAPIVATTVGRIGFEDRSNDAMEEDRTDLSAEPEFETPATPMSSYVGRSIFRTDIFVPTVFLVRMTHSTIGAAIHISQLVTEVRRESGFAIALDDLSYATFLELVSEQFGFDVTSCIKAVVPSSVGTQIVKTDSLIHLASEKTWTAVLQMWSNARRRTCEFIVERESGIALGR